MAGLIETILLKNAGLANKKNQSICFDKDFEGKGLLNKEISKLYDKKTVFSEQQFEEIVINSTVIIEKMAKLKNCGWEISELKTQLSSGVGNYKKQNEVSNFKPPHTDKSKLLNATTIGKHFNISSQRLNLILSELGWIEKDIAGWEITKLGKSIGGRQFEHETSGGTYALWPDNIFQNKRLLEVFRETTHEQTVEINSVPVPTATTPTQIFIPTASINKDNFREKFEAKHRTIDGHYVRSKAEMLIDNWLYQYGVIHAYERKLPIDEDVYCDFYIPSGNGRPQAVYIEFWGLENDPKYSARKKKKIEIYKKEGFSLIELTDADLQNIDDILAKKLRQFKIQIG